MDTNLECPQCGSPMSMVAESSADKRGGVWRIMRCVNDHQRTAYVAHLIVEKERSRVPPTKPFTVKVLKLAHAWEVHESFTDLAIEASKWGDLLLPEKDQIDLQIERGKR